MDCPTCTHTLDRHIFDQGSQNVLCAVRGCQCLTEIEDPYHWVIRIVPASPGNQKLQRMWLKFHRETDCGADGMHWRECEDFTEWMKEAYIGTN